VRQAYGATVRTAGGHQRIALLAVTLAVVAAWTTGAGAASDSAARLRPGEKYVALGSSFASGPLIPEVADGMCLRSTNDYPNLVARELKLSLTDVSCGAATTDDILTTPQGAHPPQIEAVTPDTNLVTITIGGNDVNYTVTNLGCAADAKKGQDCLGTSLQPSQIEQNLARLPGKLDATLHAIADKAPHATIVVLPYLRVFPAVAKPCPPSVPMTTRTLQYLDGFSDKLHTAIKQAAARVKRARVRFVDSYLPKDHTACAAPAERWVEGAVPASPAVMFHPNERGMQAQAKMIVAALTGK
jgi:lysophospholipase L1-like esterase